MKSYLVLKRLRQCVTLSLDLCGELIAELRQPFVNAGQLSHPLVL